MQRFEGSKGKYARSPKLRLVCRSERPSRETTSEDGLTVSPDLTLDESIKKAQLVVARIAGMGAVLAIGFLAAELLQDF